MTTILREEFDFPHPEKVMAKVRFEVDLSDAQDIKWDATQRGLLSFFAIYSHEAYLKLAEALKDKCNGGA